MRSMKNITVLTILLTFQVQAQELPPRVTLFPPQLHSLETMKLWSEEIAQQVNPELQVELLTTQAWADYVNLEHFVPLTFEGEPEGKIYDYNFYANRTPSERAAQGSMLPAAEVTEKGKFIMWDNICNFGGRSERNCKALIRMIVKHENGHYRQWRQLADEAVRSLNRTETPRDLEELRRIPGAESIFMRKWASGPHYQCREVEVYTNQMIVNEMARNSLPYVNRMLMYYTGCQASEFRLDFAPFLDTARSIFRENGVGFPPVTP